ncbi:acyloxyacyl hydrolase [Fibrisoma montanum]|uniref:Acyloxyacyl hydrolase n=1 Tax=Fibrisoma montanum TaxID=2305895 RepID=A0A418LZW0_9BACT|nr:acyloxyacyl hydrolase [Fibrisoma montanum]RIV18961.1 acyloxyacyl hydrolase [Fibrisoma montanum]
MKALLLLTWLGSAADPTEPDSVLRQIGVRTQTGFIIPHAADLKEISQSRPLGVELTYSRMAITQEAYDRCNCFARIGAYVNYVAFNNPAELGRTFGLGGYFEPLINYRKPLYFSVRATAGLAYLTRVYDADTNPRNTFFSHPISGLLALSFKTHLRLSSRLHAEVGADYNHISNGGTRQPNRGMNFPTVSAGVTYHPAQTAFPDPRNWSRPALARRFIKRVLAFGSIRTVPQTALFPERAEPLWGLTATAGYRVSRLSAFTGGLEFADDGYTREQLRRENRDVDHRRMALLGGYELWLGRYVFSTHLGYNAYQPSQSRSERVFQRYQLLYTLQDRWVLGVGLKAILNTAEGFDVRAGVRF